MNRVALVLPFATGCALSSGAPSTPPISPASQPTSVLPTHLSDARRAIAEAHSLVSDIGETIFEGYASSPRGVMIVDGRKAWLFCHDGPAADWQAIGYDDQSACPVARGATRYPVSFKATFPAVDNQVTVIVGTPPALNMTLGRYVVTLAHERLHQLQMARPGYHASTLALDLHDGDTTGMWMLNYPFPYVSPEFRTRLISQARKLSVALRARGQPEFSVAVQDYVAARAETMGVLSERDQRYAEFQLWQEGIARYIEYRLAADAASAGRTTYDYAATAHAVWEELLKELEVLDPAQHQRVIFYPLGAGEAILLDEVRPQWRRGYQQTPFTLRPWFEPQES